jgi:monoterpene epsilon-lactone hydrolase
MSLFAYESDHAAQRELEAVLQDVASTPWPEEISEARALYDVQGPPVAPDIAVEAADIDGIPAKLFTPPVVDPRRRVLFLHGGGYVYGSFLSHGGMTAEIARHSGCNALQIQYRLAPEHPYPAAIEDACAAYEWLLRHDSDPRGVAFVGDSAGGGLVMAALVTLQNLGRPLPGAAVCISPWVDLEANGPSYIDRQPLDPMIDRALSVSLAAHYLNGADPRAPTASPIHADLTGMPPLLIQVGEREVLFSEAVRLYDNALASGVVATFEEWPQMVHVWHLYFPTLRAGREAIERVGSFVRAKTAAATVESLV